MYKQIWEKYRNRLATFPVLRRPLVGSVIKETRVDKGIRQMDFSNQVGINLSTLKSIENDHQQATTVENLSRCGDALGLTVDEMILSGCEFDPANSFVCKKSPPPIIKGIRKRKRFPEEWRESVRLRFPHFELIPISPPIATKKDFFVSRLSLPPKHSVEGLNLGVHEWVVGFVSSGFNIRLVYDGEERATLTTHQGFALDGFLPHGLRNDDAENVASIYLITKLPRFDKVRILNEPARKRLETINVSQGISYLRRFKSDRRERPISVRHLSDLTESLDHEQIAKLMRIKKGSSVIYWKKIEDLLAGTGISMEEFLLWSHNEERSTFSLATASTRAMIDYSTHHAVKIYSCVPPGIHNRFFCGELLIEGKTALVRKSWVRKDNAMIAIHVQEGELEVAVGKRRSALPILKGESIYFDGNLGYVLRNPSEVQAKGFFASFPSIQF